jgi:hypothetical protein
MAAALGRLTDIDRRACRREAEQRFTVDRMADDYLRHYAMVRDGALAAS